MAARTQALRLYPYVPNRSKTLGNQLSGFDMESRQNPPSRRVVQLWSLAKFAGLQQAAAGEVVFVVAHVMLEPAFAIQFDDLGKPAS